MVIQHCSGQHGSTGPALDYSHDTTITTTTSISTTTTAAAAAGYYYCHFHFVCGLMDKKHYIQQFNDTEGPHHLGLQYAFPHMYRDGLLKEL